MIYLYNFLGAFFLGIGVTIIMSKLLMKRPPITKKQLIVYLIILASCWLVNYYIVDNFVRLMISFCLLTIIFKLMYRENTAKITIVVFLAYVIIMMSEIAFGLIALNVFNIQVKEALDSGFGIMLSNIFISSFGVAIIYTIRHFYKKEIETSEKQNSVILVILITTILIVMAILSFKHFKNGEFQIDVFIDYLVIIVFCACSGIIITENNQKTRLLKEYDLLQDYLQTTEGVLEKYRIANHENKNQLVAIHAMIKKKDKNAPKYIENLINEKLPVEVEVINNLRNISSEGLKGLMYHKICKMMKDGINVKINIAKSGRKKQKSLPVEVNKNTFKLIGIYLDNAYDAAIISIEKEVTIEGFITDEVHSLVITNSFVGEVSIDNIESPGISTKGKGHGYGLTLAKEIIEKNPMFRQHREIDGKYYSQYIDIFLK